jgi:hypothetical protein
MTSYQSARGRPFKAAGGVLGIWCHLKLISASAGDLSGTCVIRTLTPGWGDGTQGPGSAGVDIVRSTDLS